jgi:hypothetical protein
MLSACSVGFIPLESVPRKGGGYTIKRWSLLEFSVVSVPANPGALRVRRLAPPTAAEVAPILEAGLRSVRAELRKMFPSGIVISDSDTFGGSEPIEIVDDEQDQRALARRVLRGFAARLHSRQTADGRFDVTQDQIENMLDSELRNAVRR